MQINRALYLDEERIAPSTHFESLRARIAEVLAGLVAIDPALLRPGGRREMSLAAE